MYKLLPILLVIACQSEPPRPRPLRLATTTSVEPSGLLEHLLAPFEERTGLRVHVIAVGTGQALELGRRGDVDLVLVHAPTLEQTFVAEGHGLHRSVLMRNDFVLVGPADDPADIAGGEDAAAALSKIATAAASFVSRGDNSGTHVKELELWEAAGISPAGTWYLESGQGQLACLLQANEKRAYALTDRASYLSSKVARGLDVLVQGDPRLDNRYSLILLAPKRHPQANHLGALALLGWLRTQEARELVSAFSHAGQPLFTPLP